MTGAYRDKSVLVVGGLGFIGSHLTKELVQLGARVTVLDGLVPTGGSKLEHIESVIDRVRLNLSDVRDLHTLPALVKDQSIIFSLAAQTSHIRSMQSPLEDLTLNCETQLALLEACRLVNPAARLVFTSTRQVYGRSRYLPVDEDHPIAPTDINGIHKLTAENYYALYARVHGLGSITLRLTNTYGPHMDLHPQKGFVGVFIAQALRGETIHLFGDGSQRRDFNFVSDVVSALLAAGEHVGSEHEIFNLGHDEHCSLKEFLNVLASQLPITTVCQPFPEALHRIDIGDYYSSYARFHARTGWRPRVTLQQGLASTVAAYRQVQPDVQPHSASGDSNSPVPTALSRDSIARHSAEPAA